MTRAISCVAKAIAGAVTALGTGIVTAATEGGITVNEWWVILGGTLVAGATVWSFPNSERQTMDVNADQIAAEVVGG